MSTIARTLILAFFVALGAGGVAAAQPAGMTVPDSQYNSPMRGQCTDELRKDSAWRAALEKEIRVKVHEQDADLIAKNHKHVIMGYSALWIIAVVFLVFTWRKHRELQVEATRLQAEVDRLSESEGA